MRILALIRRIAKQFFRDKRTLALMFVAPLLILWLVSLIFNGSSYKPRIGIVDAPSAIVTPIQTQGAVVTRYPSETAVTDALAKQQIDASIQFVSGTLHVTLEGSDPAKNKSILFLLQKVLESRQNPSALNMNAHPPVVQYMYGSADMSSFDNFGPVMIGVFSFFFVLMISGVAFLRERTSGTLERMLATPLRRWEVVAGYVIGFGLFTTIQACLIAGFAVEVLGMLMVGKLIYLLIVTFLLSMTALTLGTFLSAFANNEFQIIQFIPIVFVPQVFFSGLFSIDNMAPWMQGLSKIMPLYYGADALRNVMVRGKGMSDIYPDLLVLLGLTVCFIGANVIALRKYRKV